MAKEPTAVAAATPSSASSSASRSYTGSASRSTATAPYASSSHMSSSSSSSTSASQRSHARSHTQQQQIYPGSSASSVSSASSASTSATHRTASHHAPTDAVVADKGKDKRRPSSRGHNTTSSSVGSSTSSSSTAAASAASRSRRRLDDSTSASSIRDDAVAVSDVGPEKFAAKVSGRETVELSSSSSSPGSDKDDTSPQQPSKRSTGSVAASNYSNSTGSSSKPSRMIVKRRTLGSSHPAASVASTSIPNKYVRQAVGDDAPSPRLRDAAAAIDSAFAAAADGSAGGHARERSGSNARRHENSSTLSASSSSSQPPQPVTPRTLARKLLQADPDAVGDGDGAASGSADPKPRPVRIKYEAPARGAGNGKREISHASLGKLIARLTDAHQYDTEFRDVFLLTFRCFCSPYDFIKKLKKRYTAVLTLCGGLDPETVAETQRVLDQIVEDEAESDRASTLTSISTARSDINSGMEANVSIMRLLSVLKFWIKESGFIEMDLCGDRRSQKKLMAFLSEIQSTSLVPSIRKHAENMFLMVAQLVRSQQQQSHQHYAAAPPALFHHPAAASLSSVPSALPGPPPALDSAPATFGLPPPPVLVASTSASSVTDSLSGAKPRVVDERSTETPQTRDRGLSAAMSKLKLTRSSSDPKRERSVVKLKLKQSDAGSADVFQLRARTAADDSSSHAKLAMSTSAPKFARGITTGSADSVGVDSYRVDDAFHDAMYRSRIAMPRNSARTSYDNVGPLTGLTAQELADQLTLVEAEFYFAKVNPRELTNKAWTREHKHRDAPHVMALIELFDATAEWVSSEILHPRLQAAERAKLLTFFIDAAENCYQMNNFNTLFEIFTGLSAPCVRQLTTTWSLVGASATDKYQFLHGICSTEDNYRNYRQQFGFAEGQPRLPCWFILVKDLFQFEESMKSTEDGLIHWHKYRRIHRVISEALDRQNLSYLPASGATATTANGISRKGKGLLRHDRRVQNYVRHRLETVRKDSSVLYQLARNANTQESILFVNSLSEAGFL